MPPFFLIAYTIFLNFGSSMSGKSASSSTLSNGVESASTSMFLEPLFVVTPSTLTYCSRLSSERLNSMMSVLMSSGTVTPIPISSSSPFVVSVLNASLYTLTSPSSGSLFKNPHLTILTNAFTRFFLSAFPPMVFAAPVATLPSISSCSSSSKSNRRSNFSCNSLSSSFASLALSSFPSFTRLLTSFFLSLIAFNSFCISLFMNHVLSFLNSIHVEVCKNILLFCLDSLFLCLCCCVVPVLQFRKHRIDNVLCGCSFDALRNMVVFFKII